LFVLNLFFFFRIFYEGSQHAHALIPVCSEVEAVFFALTHLKQIVVQRFFTYVDFGGRILQADPKHCTISLVNTIVQFAPLGGLFNNVGDRSLFRPFCIRRLPKITDLKLTSSSDWFNWVSKGRAGCRCLLIVLLLNSFF
jgi:hypothetical protein